MFENIDPDRERVESALTKVFQHLERKPDSWHHLEVAGRCLRWLKNPSADEYFAKAIEHYPLRKGNPASYKPLGNLYRLSGAHDEARQVFLKARDLYASRVFKGNPDDTFVEHMALVSFLAGRDQEVQDLVIKLKTLTSDRDLIVYSVGKLAHARQTEDSKIAGEAVREIISWIKRERANVWDGYGVMLWDWYEIALDLFRTLNNKQI